MGKPINVEVTLRRNEHPERMIKRFTRKVKKSGILDDYRERMYYTKKSVKRRKQKYLKKRNAQKAQKQNEQKKKRQGR